MLAHWRPADVELVDLSMRPVRVDPGALAVLTAAIDVRQHADALDPRRQRSTAPALVRAALAGESLSGPLLRLIGAGPGSTPAGDDVVVGVLAALRATGHDRAAAAIARDAVRLLDRTTSASRMYLSAAADGRFAERVHELVQGLGSTTAGATAARSAARWGATSGLDLLSGIVAAARRPGPVPKGRMTSDAPSLAARVLPRLYRDSVALMAIASTTESIDGVARVGAVMATPANLEILRESDMLPEQLAAAPDDLVIVVRGTTDEVVAGALDAAEAALTTVESARRKEDRAAATIGEGIAAMSSDDPERPATIATISIPGAYAAVVAERALRDGLHVFCFSDNVPISDEVRVKRLARERRLLHMGPDCGTAIIDGIPLGFANVVRRGPVGMVAASGTGAQEVSRLLDLAGAGISQLIGVGGRDLSPEVDGIMTDLALDLLEEDPETEVIVVVSKPPADAVATRLLARLSAIAKKGTPTIACFLGADDSGDDDAGAGVIVRGTLEGGAIAAAAAAGHTLSVDVAGAPPETAPPGRILGLYTGGTLASETKILLKRAGVKDMEVLDLGDDEYTAGKPHPMIDPEARAARIEAAGADPTVGILLLDVVLGYGSSPDPSSPVVAAVAVARAAATADGRELLVIGSVCGTPGDPQGLARQTDLLEGAGIVLAPTNAAAARLAAALATAVRA